MQRTPTAPLPLFALLLLAAFGAGCRGGPPAEAPARAATDAAAPGTRPSGPTSGTPESAAQAQADADTVVLEGVEEVTESFANSLFDLSLEAREGDYEALAARFVPRLDSVRIPATPGPVEPYWKWVQHRDWLAASAMGLAADRSVMLAEFRALLDHFTILEDVRFKVKSVTQRPVSGAGNSLTAAFKCWMIGRNADGQREWAKGTGTLSGSRESAESPWLLDSLTFDQLASYVADKDLFSEVSAPAGVAAPDPSFADRGGTALIAHGVATADVNGDGRLDVFVTGFDRNWLYLGQADGKFEDVAAAARVATLETPGTAPLFLDFDNDGDADLFIASVGRQSLFENRLVPDGQLTFRDVSTRARVAVEAVGFSATAGDVDGNGFTDIAVACYNHYGRILPDSWDAAANGTPNLLFLNQGDGRFIEAAAERGVADSRWSYGVTFADIDGDADLDLLVANDFGPGSGLFENDGKGHFTDVTRERGLERPGYGMGVSVSDYDADGDLDVHVTKMSSNAGARVVAQLAPDSLPDAGRIRDLFSGNTLFENLGGGRFADVSRKAGPFSGGWAWGGGFLDVDNDGLEDIYTPNGFISGKLLHDT